MSTATLPDMGTALTLHQGQQEFTSAQVATLNQLGVTDASRGDLAIFFHQAVRTGLDPFAKQIYMIGRNQKNQKTQQWETKYTIQTGIDGYRLIARRAADRARESLGYEDTMWCGDDGQWRDVWLSNTPPAAAKVTVVRKGKRFSATALWTEYVQTKKDGEPSAMWVRMSSTMLAKCAEALALRKAFPQDLSGIYTTDEMGQADSETVPALRAVPEPVQVEQSPAATETVNRYRESATHDEPAAQVDWSSAFETAKGNRDALTALRNQGRRAGLPTSYGMFAAIEAELTRLTAEETPVEGTVID